MNVLKKELMDMLKGRELSDKQLVAVDSLFEDEIGKIVHKNILEKGERTDGRKIDDVRELYSEVGLFNRTHGSALFSRGNTQALAVTTLGPPAAGAVTRLRQRPVGHCPRRAVKDHVGCPRRSGIPRLCLTTTEHDPVPIALIPVYERYELYAEHISLLICRDTVSPRRTRRGGLVHSVHLNAEPLLVGHHTAKKAILTRPPSLIVQTILNIHHRSSIR